VPGLTGCTAIAAGGRHACAICDKRIACWGDDQTGQLGTGALASAPVSLPQTLAPLVDDAWSEIHAGAAFTCALSMRGVIACWGFDERAALGNGVTASNLPVVVRSVPIPSH
jgi:alpha-tubulin suppressor-like RCC1 family protein